MSRLLLQPLPPSATASPLVAENPARPALGQQRASVEAGGTSSRVEDALRKADDELASLMVRADKIELLKRAIRNWEYRYAMWRASDFRSEYQDPKREPIHPNDFVLLITGLQARLEALR